MNANETLFRSIFQSNASANPTSYQVCIDTPPHVVSDGLWGDHTTAGSPLRSSFPIFQLQVIVICAITQASHFLLKNLGLPVLISQLIAGLILGPSLNLKALEEYKMMLFPYGSQDTLATITSLGFVLFVFENGVQMDFSMIIRTGKKGWAIAFIGLATPLIVGYPSAVYFSDYFPADVGEQTKEALIVLATHSITSFAVIASTLNDLKILNSELGRLALSSALVGDILSNMYTSIASTFLNTDNTEIITTRLGSLFALVILISSVCRPAMFWVIKHTPEGREVKDIYINIIIAILLILGSLSVLLKREFILLPFIFGLATPEGPPLGSALVKRIQLFGTGLLLPIFLTTCAMKVDFSLEYKPASIIIPLAIALLTHLVKIVAYLASSIYSKMPLKDALSLALILNCKGVVEVCMYNALFDRKDIHAQTYAMMIISIMIITSIVHVLVKYLYDPSRKYGGYQKRNIFSLKPNSDLRILACIHKHHHTTPITIALDLCYPTAEDPIIVDALHLIELVGRSSPIFISHRLQKALDSGVQNSYSENIILAFNLYEHDNQGAATVNTYTAISPPNLMHEDVCNLALDKVASIIILPFHRKWSIDGKIEYEDKNMRSLNCMVLEKAPCSVGILVSRSAHQRGSPLRLAMIFLGGKDDREALCLANRAARDPTTNLVVYHFVTKDNIGTSDMETLLDNAVLKDDKRAHFGQENVSHREIIVEDGLQTAAILRELVDAHDFFLVGRRHGINSPQTSGLEDWSEFSELGLIGDYLASTDLDGRSSVLVVQQQQLSL